MKLKSHELQSQIVETNSRISELEPQLTGQTAAFETAQKAFITGKVTLDAFHTEQAKMLLVETTIDSLQIHERQLELELKSALENEARQTIIEQMKAVANDAQKGFDAFVVRRAELDKAARTAIDALENFRGAQNTFAQNFRKLAPNVESLTSVSKYTRGEFDTVVAELETAGITKESFALAASPVLNLPPLEFGQRLVEVAEQIVTIKNHHADQARRDKIKDAQMQELALKNQKIAAALAAADEERREELKALREQQKSQNPQKARFYSA
jgi:hypothetical protein